MEWAGRNWEIQLERVHLLNVIDDAGPPEERMLVVTAKSSGALQ
jgi:hypothetical protein